MAHFTLSKEKILEQFDDVQKLCDTVSYSSKTNPSVTPILEQNRDCLFSVHLPGELINIKDHSRVLYLAQAWDYEQIQSLLEKSIQQFVIDNKRDLEVLLHYLKKNPSIIIKQLLLRLKLKENTVKTEKYYVFGMTASNVRAYLHQLQNHSQINTLGIHFHRKTQNIAEWNLIEELDDIFTEKDFQCIDVINMGGGLPARYADTNEKTFDGIKNKIKSLQVWLSQKDISLIIEPGRYIAAPAGQLHTKIIAIHDTTIIVDASVYNSDMDALIVPVKLRVQGEQKKGTAYSIKGLTPCSLDLFRYKVYLNGPRLGDIITFLEAGAYNFTTNFVNLHELQTQVVQ